MRMAWKAGTCQSRLSDLGTNCRVRYTFHPRLRETKLMRAALQDWDSWKGNVAKDARGYSDRLAGIVSEGKFDVRVIVMGQVDVRFKLGRTKISVTAMQRVYDTNEEKSKLETTRICSQSSTSGISLHGS